MVAKMKGFRLLMCTIALLCPESQQFVSVMRHATPVQDLKRISTQPVRAGSCLLRMYQKSNDQLTAAEEKTGLQNFPNSQVPTGRQGSLVSKGKWHGRRPFPEPIVFEATEKHTATVIFLHGFGAQGPGRGTFLAENLDLPWCKTLIPIAPKRSLRVLGQSIPFQNIQSWASVDELVAERFRALTTPPSLSNLAASLLSLPSRMPVAHAEGVHLLLSELGLGNIEGDETDLARNVAYLRQLIEAEVRSGIPLNRIVLLGFSQGGCVTLECAMEMGVQLGGVVALSTWFPKAREGRRALREARAQGGFAETPMLVCHGDADWVVPLQHGREVGRRLRKAGVDFDLRVYQGMGHDINDEVLEDVRDFIAKRAPRGPARTLNLKQQPEPASEGAVPVRSH